MKLIVRKSCITSNVTEGENQCLANTNLPMDVSILKAGEATEISWNLWRLKQGTYTVPAVCFLFQMVTLVLFVLETRSCSVALDGLKLSVNRPG